MELKHTEATLSPPRSENIPGELRNVGTLWREVLIASGGKKTTLYSGDFLGIPRKKMDILFQQHGNPQELPKKGSSSVEIQLKTTELR